MKVSAIYRDTSEGEGFIYIRINKGESRTYHTTGIKVKQGQFKEGKVVSHPKARTLNDKIKTMIVQHSLNGINGTNGINGIQKKKGPGITIEAYGMEAILGWQKTKRDSTLYQYKGELERFVAFTGALPISKITPEILSDYKKHLLKNRTANTAWKSLKFLKTLFHKAIRERVIEHNPFDQVETIKYKNPEKQFLTQKQIEAIDTYVQREDTPERIRFIGNWFLLGCYTGLRFSDMQKFHKGLIREGRLILYTTKTKEAVSLPLVDKLKELLQRVHYKPLDLYNSTYNQYLKVLAKACDLPPINAHMSRHTFAVRCAKAGLSPEVTAKIMGIVNLKVMAVYYKLGSERIDEEFGKLF